MEPAKRPSSFLDTLPPRDKLTEEDLQQLKIVEQMRVLRLQVDLPKPKPHSVPDQNPKRFSLSRSGSLTALISPRVTTPRQLAKKYSSELNQLRDLITIKGPDPIPPLFQKVKEVITSDNSNVLVTAAGDFWRNCRRLRIIAADGHVLQSGAADSRGFLNQQCQTILAQFQQDRKIQIALPDSLDWTDNTFCEKWIRQNCTELDSPIARFIRSFSQCRYIGIGSELILVPFGSHPKEVRIKVELDIDQVTITRTIFKDSSIQEIIQVPLKVTERATGNEITTVFWEITYSYDADCFLVEAYSIYRE